MKNQRPFLILAAALLLSGCSSAKEQLGLTRHSPDEFSVVKRAPLEMPPDYTLRPPQPGAMRPQEAQPEMQAQEAVFGSASTVGGSPDKGEAVLLQEAGAANAAPDIRRRVDAETASMAPDERPVAERLLGWTTGSKNEASASVVDAKAEAERLKKNAEEGKPVTEGETPSVKK